MSVRCFIGVIKDLDVKTSRASQRECQIGVSMDIATACFDLQLLLFLRSAVLNRFATQFAKVCFKSFGLVDSRKQSYFDLIALRCREKRPTDLAVAHR